MASTKVPGQKVILCGEYGVGKSSIFRRFTNNTFVTATDRKSTLGLDHFDKIYSVNNNDIRVSPPNYIEIIKFDLFHLIVWKLVAAMGYWRDGTNCFYHIKLL